MSLKGGGGGGGGVTCTCKCDINHQHTSTSVIVRHKIFFIWVMYIDSVSEVSNAEDGTKFYDEYAGVS